MRRPVEPALRSLPVQKARVPAPEIIATHKLLSASKALKIWSSSSLPSGVNELLTSGRLIITSRIGPRRSTLMNSYSSSRCVGVGGTRRSRDFWPMAKRLAPCRRRTQIFSSRPSCSLNAWSASASSATLLATKRSPVLSRRPMTMTSLGPCLSCSTV
ncbi:hypothetical protein D3C76_1170730 [compost metagenome]